MCRNYFLNGLALPAPSGSEYGLRPDYQSRWDEFINANSLQDNQEFIQSFYIGEEPTWNGISYSELKLATDYVKLTIPDIPIMIVEAYPIIDLLKVPNSVDWVGFDHYFVEDPKTDVLYLNELNTLKSKFTTLEQKLVLIMDTHYISDFHGDYGEIALNDMDKVANSYYDLAKSEPKTIAILGYF